MFYNTYLPSPIYNIATPGFDFKLQTKTIWERSIPNSSGGEMDRNSPCESLSIFIQIAVNSAKDNLERLTTFL